MGWKLPDTISSLREKLATTELVKFLFSIVILGLAAAVVDKTRGEVHTAAVWSLTVSLTYMALSILACNLYYSDDRKKMIIARVIGGLATLLWLSAAVPLFVTVAKAGESLVVVRSIDFESRIVPRRGGKTKMSAAGRVGSIAYACAIFCTLNWFGCLMQWYYEAKIWNLSKRHNPEAVPLDDQGQK